MGRASIGQGVSPLLVSQKEYVQREKLQCGFAVVEKSPVQAFSGKLAVDLNIKRIKNSYIWKKDNLKDLKIGFFPLMFCKNYRNRAAMPPEPCSPQRGRHGDEIFLRQIGTKTR